MIRGNLLLYIPLSFLGEEKETTRFAKIDRVSVR